MRGIIDSQTQDDIKIALVNKISSAVTTMELSSPQRPILTYICLKYLCEVQEPSPLFSAIRDLTDNLLNGGDFRPDCSFFDESVSLNNIQTLCFRLPESSAASIISACWPDVWAAWKQLETDSTLSALTKVFSVKLPIWATHARSLKVALERFLANPVVEPPPTEKDLENAVDFLSKFSLLFKNPEADVFVSVCDNLSNSILILVSQTSMARNADNYATSPLFKFIKTYIIDPSPALHSPVAAFMIQLDRTCIEVSETHERILASCIDHLVGDITTTGNLKSVIQRFLEWSQWSLGEGSTDLWVIGILAKFGNTQPAVGLTKQSIFDEILVPMLAKTLEILTFVDFSSGPLMNILAFILLVGGLLGYSDELCRHCSELISFLRRILGGVDTSKRHEAISIAFSQIGHLFKLACSGKTNKLTKLFDLISRRFTCPAPGDLNKFLQQYNWTNLAKAGPSAGFRLRRLWLTWSNGSNLAPKLQLTMAVSSLGFLV